MKKITLLAMSFIMALTVSAQGVGKDITDTFENTDFETEDISGWTTSGPSNADGRGAHAQGSAASNNYQGTWFMEAWNNSGTNFSSFEWSQTQSVPNGYYIVKALAHAIQQANATQTPKGVYVFAEDVKTPVTSTASAEYLVLAKVTDGELKIGLCGDGTNVNWMACDYFRIIQCDGSTEEEAKLSWVKYELELLKEEFSYIDGEYMSSKLADEMSASADAVETVSTYAAANTLWEKMKKQFDDANACIDAYALLIEKVDEVLVFAEAQGAEELLNMVEEVQANYEDGVYDAAGALAEITAFDEAVYKYNLSILDGTSSFDVTNVFVKDASVSSKENSAAWTIKVTNKSNDMPAWGHNSIEFWQCDFEMSQTITDLPNGKYVVKVQGFYRQGGSDGGAAYKANTENITAKLFANKASTPLVSLYKYTGSEMGVSADLRDGYVSSMNSANLAFSTENSFTGGYYYDENELEVIVTDNTLTFGVKNASNVGDRWCIFRNFELWYYGNYPAVNFQAKTEEAKDYIANNEETVPYAINLEINEYIKNKRRYTIAGAYSDAEVNAAIEEFEAIWDDALKAIELFAELKAFYKKVDDELLPLNYPGADALTAAQQSLVPYFAIDCETNNHAKLKELKAAMDQAVYDYYTSQVANPDQAADYTPFISSPNFETRDAWTWALNSDGGSDCWNGSCRPASDGGASRPGVNLWGTVIKSVDVHQVLTGLPDGLYKVSAEMITQTNFATDQHVYACGASKSVSENLKIAGWDTFEWTELTTDYAVVAGGALSIGAESSQGGSGSEGWFQATNFKLYYYGPATAEQVAAAWDETKERVEEALDVLIPNEEKELAVAWEQALPLAAEAEYDDACELVVPVLFSKDSVITASKNFFHKGYYAKLDTLPNGNYEGYEGCDSTYEFASSVIAMADEILEADDATCKLFPELDNKLHAYANYASSLRDAEHMFDTLALVKEYKDFVADSVIRPQVDTLLLKLRRAGYVDTLRAQLIEALDILRGTANISKEYVEGEVADVIVNPTCDIKDKEDKKDEDVNNVPGWIWTKGNGDKATHDAEHYDVNVNDSKKVRLLNSWAPGLTSSFKQEIIGIPDGTYRLTVAARTDGDNAYIYAATTPSGIVNDTTKWEMIRNYGNTKGEIWKADSLAWAEAECPTDTAQMKDDFPYFMVNYVDSLKHGIGYGWSWHVIEDIEVTNHYLAIGFTANPEETGENFTGSWMSTDDWKLELISISEEQSEYTNPFEDFDTTIEPEEKPEEKPEDPDTAVEMIETAPVVKGIYDLFGRRIDAITAPGLYIVNGKKVLVK